jgi:hypothetical protein
MVMMPMREQNRFDTSLFVLQDLMQALGPDRFSFAGVDEDALGTRAEEIGVCALQSEFAGVVGENSNDGGAEAGDGGEGGEGGGHGGGLSGVNGMDDLVGLDGFVARL